MSSNLAEVVRRGIHTAEVTGSIPVAPTSENTFPEPSRDGACQKICQNATGSATARSAARSCRACVGPRPAPAPRAPARTEIPPPSGAQLARVDQPADRLQPLPGDVAADRFARDTPLELGSRTDQEDRPAALAHRRAMSGLGRHTGEAARQAVGSAALRVDLLSSGAGRRARPLR